METPSRAENFDNFIHARALNLVNLLQGLTPYERRLVLQEAQALWEEGESSQAQAGEADATVFSSGQWLAGVFIRLSPPARAGLLEVAKRLDEMERFERLVEPEE